MSTRKIYLFECMRTEHGFETRETTQTNAELEKVIQVYQGSKYHGGRMIAEAARETLRSRQEKY